MAEVTYGTPTPQRHVIGDLVVKFFVVSGVTGSVIHTGMANILYAAQQPFTEAGTASLVTGLAIAAGVITLTSSAPMVHEVVMVIGREG